MYMLPISEVCLVKMFEKFTLYSNFLKFYKVYALWNYFYLGELFQYLIDLQEASTLMFFTGTFFTDDDQKRYVGL